MSLKDNMDPRIEELLPFYALDALTEEEKELVESYLAEHPEARLQLQELQPGASALPYAVAPVEPPGRVKEALMKRVASDVQERSRSSVGAVSSARVQKEPAQRGSRFENIFRVLSLGAAAIAVIWAFVLNAQVGLLQGQVDSLNEQVAAQSQSIDDMAKTLFQLNETDVITVSLKSTREQSRPLGQLIANPKDKSAVVVISGLPPLEPGKTYQVWLIGDAPVSAGLLTVDENGRSVLIITSEESIDSFKALGISIEPEGGSAQPTEDQIVVLSEL
jgi:anti-sigma-K factor RskA